MEALVVDYGLGNLKSMERALESANHKVLLSSDPDIIAMHPMVILPGVGAFDRGMANLREHGLDAALRIRAESSLPLVGVCLGMQLLFDGSEEGSGDWPGLGVIPGFVRRIPKDAGQGEVRAVPHVGWNHLSWKRRAESQGAPACFFDQHMSLPEIVYFTHSFFAQPELDDDVAALTDVGELSVCSAVSRGRTVGFQFHPEKSGRTGVTLLSDTLTKLLEISIR